MALERNQLLTSAFLRSPFWNEAALLVGEKGLSTLSTDRPTFLSTKWAHFLTDEKLDSGILTPTSVFGPQLLLNV